MRISDWSSDVVPSDLGTFAPKAYRARRARLVATRHAIGQEAGNPPRSWVKNLFLFFSQLGDVTVWAPVRRRVLPSRGACPGRDAAPSEARAQTICRILALRPCQDCLVQGCGMARAWRPVSLHWRHVDRKSTRLNSSH